MPWAEPEVPSQSVVSQNPASQSFFLVITTSQQIFLGAHNNIFSGSHFETWIFNVWTQPRKKQRCLGLQRLCSRWLAIILQKITYIRLQNAECLRAVPTFQSYWCSLDMYWQAELKECEDASVTLLEGFFLTTASIGKTIKIDSWRLKKAWWCQDRNDFHNWNMGLSKVGNSIYHHDEIQVKHRSVWKISWFSKSSKKMKLKVAYQENNNNNQAVQTLSCWHERFQLGVFSSCKFA